MVTAMPECDVPGYRAYFTSGLQTAKHRQDQAEMAVRAQTAKGCTTVIPAALC